MANNAKNDGNSNPTVICASKADGVTIIQITADPTTHGLSVVDGTGQTDNGNNNGVAMIDQNTNAVWAALSSDGSGSLVEVYGDVSGGKVLILSI